MQLQGVDLTGGGSGFTATKYTHTHMKAGASGEEKPGGAFGSRNYCLHQHLLINCSTNQTKRKKEKEEKRHKVKHWGDTEAACSFYSYQQHYVAALRWIFHATQWCQGDSSVYEALIFPDRPKGSRKGGKKRMGAWGRLWMWHHHKSKNITRLRSRRLNSKRPLYHSPSPTCNSDDAVM